jgi:hypothetical protein
MAKALTKMEIRSVKRELDKMQLEILRLKAAILPVESLSKKERTEIEMARKEIAKGHWVSFANMTKEFG